MHRKVDLSEFWSIQFQNSQKYIERLQFKKKKKVKVKRPGFITPGYLKLNLRQWRGPRVLMQ